MSSVHAFYAGHLSPVPKPVREWLLDSYCTPSVNLRTLLLQGPHTVLWDHQLITVAHYKFRDPCGPQGLACVQCAGLNLDLNLNVNLERYWGGTEETGKLTVEMRTLLERHGHTEPRRDTAHTRQAM